MYMVQKHIRIQYAQSVNQPEHYLGLCSVLSALRHKKRSNRQLSQKMLMYYDKKAKEMNRHGQHITS